MHFLTDRQTGIGPLLVFVVAPLLCGVRFSLVLLGRGFAGFRGVWILSLFSLVVLCCILVAPLLVFVVVALLVFVV